MSVRGDDETVAGTIPGVGPTATASKPPEVPPQGVVEGAERIANRYQIVRWLGGGGMGRVYEAFDSELEERVALKVLKAGLTDDSLERFKREVRLTRRIQHKNVARMFDIGEHAGEKFLTMELIDGEPLTRVLGSGPMPWHKLRSAALQIANGLAAAHECGVIHRDLKPDNVLVETATGRLVITDFGIARSGDDPNVTQIGAVVGTPRYMAPEQLAGGEIDHRADLFSYGVMLFELATGTRPWAGDNPIAIAVAQATQPARPFIAPAVPPSFAALVMSCLHLEPAQRPQTATDIATRIAAETPTPETATGRTPKFSMTPPAGVAVTGTSAAVEAFPTLAGVETTIVVLPVTCPPGDEYLADGMHEDLVDTLSTTPTVRVRPVGLVRGHIDPDVRELGRRFDVEHVVSASLRRTPTGLRISARMISVADGFQIWAHRADCTESEILAQTDILARGIASALSTRAHTATRPMDPRAVDLFLRARAEIRLFMGEHVVRGAELLEEAAALAPSSPAILGAYAYARAQAWVLTANQDLLAPAQAAVDRALASGHGEGYVGSAILKNNLADTIGAATDLGLALARAPMSAHTHEHLGKFLFEIGPIEDAKKHFDMAVGLDPGRARPIAPELVRYFSYLEDWEASEVLIESLERSDVVGLQRVALVLRYRMQRWRGQRPARLQDDSTMLLQRFGPNLVALLRHLDRPVFDAAVIDRELAAHFREVRPRRGQLFSLQIVAEEAATAGHTEFLLVTLEHAIRNGLIDITWMDRCPLFQFVRGHERFIDMRDRVAAHAMQLRQILRSIAPT